MGDLLTASDALISECGQYRYWLARTWDAGTRALPIIMLNPSTADAAIDDPTIRRCVAFAKREGFGGIRVMNLFAFRATSPKDMLAAGNPYGPDNEDHLLQLIVDARNANTPILCAWGAHGIHGMAKRLQAYAQVNRARLVCLGKTNGGHPRHPLYVKGDQPFEPFGALPSSPAGR